MTTVNDDGHDNHNNHNDHDKQCTGEGGRRKMVAVMETVTEEQRSGEEGGGTQDNRQLHYG